MRSSCLLLACLFTSYAAVSGLPAQAQLNPDRTLGGESSTLSDTDVNGLPANLIEGGATRGGNLFHSFLDFNINEGDRVYFDSPLGIDFILSRVTGGDLTNINGLLGTTGESNAALILMNPNGIVFGENSALDVKGAFTATTATGMQLGAAGSFSAANPENDNLLSINPSAFFFNLLTTTRPEIRVAGSQGLQVPVGESLLLLGNDVSFDGGSVISPGSRVEIVAVGDARVLDVGENSSVVLDEGVRKGGILIENDSVVDTRFAQGGEIRLTANDIQIQSGSRIRATTLSDDDVGGIAVKSDDRLVIDSASVSTTAELGATGRGGDISLFARNIDILNTASITTITLGEEDAGNIDIAATEEASILGDRTGRLRITAAVGEGGTGQGGNINISPANLAVDGRAFVSVGTFGAGEAGDLLIDVSDNARFGISGDTISGSIASFIGGEASTGKGGNVEVSANSIDVLNGFNLSTGTFGRGDAGNLKVTAFDSLRIDGASFAGEQTAAASNVGSLTADGTGRAGDVEISAGRLDVTDGGVILSSTTGDGDAGVVTISVLETARFDGINASSSVASGIVSNGGEVSIGRGGEIRLSATNLEVTEGAQLRAFSAGRGEAGSIFIDVVETVRLDGAELSDGQAIPSFIGSSVLKGGTANGGNVEVTAANLEIMNGAGISASVSGRGDAGNVTIDVSRTVRVDGVDPITTQSPSSISSNLRRDSNGQGGNVEITAANVEVTNGGQIDTSTFGEGDAGSIVLNVLEAVRVDGVNPIIGRSPSNIESGVQFEGKGQGGSVEIAAANLDVTNGGRIGTPVFGEGDAGDVVLNISDTVRVEGVIPMTGLAPSTIISSIEPNAKGTGGTIEIVAANLEVIDGGQIDTSTFGEGDAGSIVLEIFDTVRLSGDDRIAGIFPSSIGSGTETGSRGQGGNIDISATSLYLDDQSQIAAAAFGEGDAGRVDLTVVEQIFVENSGIGTRSLSGSGGEITIEAGGVLLRADGDIFTFVDADEGTGGSINIDADYVVALEDSDILAFSTDGRGGNIDLTRTTLFSQNLNFAAEDLSEDALIDLDDNSRVDINATGGVESGQISANDASFIENDLAELTDELIDADTLIASTCISGNEGSNGTFVARGSDRTPQSPTAPLTSSYPLGPIQSIPSAQSTAIQEPQGVYQLANGRLVMSHRCE